MPSDGCGSHGVDEHGLQRRAVQRVDVADRTQIGLQIVQISLVGVEDVMAAGKGRRCGLLDRVELGHELVGFRLLLGPHLLDALSYRLKLSHVPTVLDQDAADAELIGLPLKFAGEDVH